MSRPTNELPPGVTATREGIVYRKSTTGLVTEEIGHVMKYEGRWEARDAQRRVQRR